MKTKLVVKKYIKNLAKQLGIEDPMQRDDSYDDLMNAVEADVQQVLKEVL